MSSASHGQPPAHIAGRPIQDGRVARGISAPGHPTIKICVSMHCGSHRDFTHGCRDEVRYSLASLRRALRVPGMEAPRRSCTRRGRSLCPPRSLTLRPDVDHGACLSLGYLRASSCCSAGVGFDAGGGRVICVWLFCGSARGLGCWSTCFHPSAGAPGCGRRQARGHERDFCVHCNAILVLLVVRQIREHRNRTCAAWPARCWRSAPLLFSSSARCLPGVTILCLSWFAWQLVPAMGCLSGCSRTCAGDRGGQVLSGLELPASLWVAGLGAGWCSSSPPPTGLARRSAFQPRAPHHQRAGVGRGAGDDGAGRRAHRAGRAVHAAARLAEPVISTPSMSPASMVSDGEEAVRLAVTHRPDVILMDLRMPEWTAPPRPRNCATSSPRPGAGARPPTPTTTPSCPHCAQRYRAAADSANPENCESRVLLRRR